MKRIIYLLFLVPFFVEAQFSVASTIPASNALDINVSSNVVINFTENVDVNTLTLANISIIGSNGLPIIFSTPLVAGSAAIFNPNRNFFPGEKITITITDNVSNDIGANLSKAFSFQFTAAVAISSPGEFPLGQNTITASADGAISVTTADLDGDGDLDVLSSSANDDSITWYENNGLGDFSIQHTITTLADYAHSVTAADLDGDGDLDVVSASAYDDKIAWYENDGLGNFGSQNIITLTADVAYFVSTGDLDNDGDLDVLSASRQDDSICWYENDGTGNFGVKQIITILADEARCVSSADLDGDGDLDVLSASSNDDRIAWYENDGSGNFGVQQTITTLPNGPFSVTTADLNNDGYLDVLSSSAYDDRIAWYENDGLGNFGIQQTITTLANIAYSVSTADLDGDGDIDVLSASAKDDRIAWYENDGLGNFGSQLTITTLADRAWSVTTGDLDGDGDLDVVSASFVDDRIAWYENSCDNKTLGLLTGTGLDLSPVFDPGIFNYTSSVCNAITSTIISATLSNAGVAVVGLGTINLYEGPNTIIVSGSNSCGDIIEYTIEVNRLTPIEQQITWNGSVSTDWNNPNNWTPNIAPLECLEIIIPSTLNPPLITGIKTIKDLEISSGTTFTVPVGATLNVTGDLNMYSLSNLYSGIIVKGTLTVSGSTKYHRFANAQTNGNDLLAPPLSGQSWTSFLTSDSNYNEGLIFNNGVEPLTTYLFGPFEKGATDDYLLYNDNTIASLSSGKGYRSATSSVSGDALSFTGTILTGSIEIPISDEVTGDFPEWNLIGNPYPSYISVDAFLNHVGSVSGVTNLSLLDSPTAAIYGYDADNTDVTGSIWTITNLLEGPDLIAPGQGFFVTSKNASANLEFTPDMQVSGASDDFIQGRLTNNSNFVKLIASSGSDSSSTSIYFHNNGTTGLDAGYDAAIFGGTVPEFSLYSQLVSENEGETMVIQTLNPADANTVVVPLGLNVSQGQQVIIRLGDYNFTDAVSVYLEDNYNNTFTLLNTTDYIFTANQTLDGTGRFYLRFETEGLSTEEVDISKLNIRANQLDQTIVIEGDLVNETKAIVFDLLGREILRQDLDSLLNKNVIDANILSSGIYIIKLKDANSQYSKKLIIN